MLPSLLILWSCISAASARATPSDICDCSGTRNGGPGSESYICGDPRLGPIVLPQMLPLASFITTYDRFGGLTPGEFLAKWTDSSGNYAYPEQNGFQLDEDGDAINGTMVLQPDTLVDRFGSEFGVFISAAVAPYSQRALPPSNLDTNPASPEFPYNYHIYRVLKPLSVVGGPIAPWFGQPGLGAQFFTGEVGNIMALIDGGYLKRENASVLVEEAEHGCGR